MLHQHPSAHPKSVHKARQYKGDNKPNPPEAHARPYPNIKAALTQRHAPWTAGRQKKRRKKGVGTASQKEKNTGDEKMPHKKKKNTGDEKMIEIQNKLITNNI